MQKAETPHDLLAEFKLATGKGQLIRANEMAAKLFAHLISAQALTSVSPVLWTDIQGKPEMCDPAACACKTSWTPVAGPDHGLVTYPETTAAAPQGPTGEVSDTIAQCITPHGYIELAANPSPLGDGPVEHPLFGPIPEAIPINTETLEFINEETPAPKSRKKK